MATIALKKPHSDVQHQMITYPGNVVSFCGRRFGKTDAYVQRIFRSMQQRPGMYWWVGLSWRSASMKRAWREVMAIARKVLGLAGLPERGYINRANYEIRLPGLGEIWFRTADNPSSCAGEGVHGAVLDEFSLMQSVIWDEYIEATLLDYRGWAAFAGVPKGNNWAANLWRSAGDMDGWVQLQASTYQNPFIDADAIDKIKRRIPERLFRQEYLADIIDDAGGVFQRVLECATAQPLTRANGGQYIAGVDLATEVDFTVVSVFDVEAREQVYMDRFNRLDYIALENRLEAIYRRFKLDNMLIESNGIGRPVIDALRARNLLITPFTTTNATKDAAIRNLQAAFEHDEIRILSDDVQINELQAFEQTRNKAGSYSYSAPSGMHDDCVMSLAIGWHGLKIGESPLVLANPFI